MSGTDPTVYVIDEGNVPRLLDLVQKLEYEFRVKFCKRFNTQTPPKYAAKMGSFLFLARGTLEMENSSWKDTTALLDSSPDQWIKYVEAVLNLAPPVWPVLKIQESKSGQVSLKRRKVTFDEQLKCYEKWTNTNDGKSNDSSDGTAPSSPIPPEKTQTTNEELRSKIEKIESTNEEFRSELMKEIRSELRKEIRSELMKEIRQVKRIPNPAWTALIPAMILNTVPELFKSLKTPQKNTGNNAGTSEERPTKRQRNDLWKPTLEPIAVEIKSKNDKANWYLADNQKAKLFIRHCTQKCFQTVWDTFLQEKADWKKHWANFLVFVITGPPGLGKSWSANYFIWKLLRMRQNIWFHHCHDTEPIRVLTKIEFQHGANEPVVESYKEKYIADNAVPEGTWYLYDSVGGSSSDESEKMLSFQRQKTGVPCVIFSSPKDKNYQQGLKHMIGGKVMYFWMPPWEWDEIASIMKELYKEWGVSTKEQRSLNDFKKFIKTLFDLWGGSPRRLKKYADAFRSSGDDIAREVSREDFEEEMRNISPEIVKNGPFFSNKAIQDIAGRNPERSGSSHKAHAPSWLVSPCPVKSRRGPFQHRVYRFSSERVECEFLDYVAERNSDEVLQFCREVFQIGAAKGLAFEKFAHFVLTRKSDNSFRWRKYSEKSRIFELTLPKCESRKCDMKDDLGGFVNVVSDCVKKDQTSVIEPTSAQQDAIDMFVVLKRFDNWQVLAMQDTISNTHSFHPVKILEYRAAIKEAFSRAGVTRTDDFFLHVVVVPCEKKIGAFSLKIAKHKDQNYWFPPQEKPADVINSVKDKCRELDLKADTFNKWTKTKAKKACGGGIVRGYCNFEDEKVMAVGAGAQLLADAGEEVKKCTWVLDGFFK